MIAKREGRNREALTTTAFAFAFAFSFYFISSRAASKGSVSIKLLSQSINTYIHTYVTYVCIIYNL